MLRNESYSEKYRHRYHHPWFRLWWADAYATIHAHSGGGISEIVILKLDSDGTYQWHTFYGTDSYDEGHGIAIDGNNNVCVVGSSNAAWDGPSGEAPVLAHNDNHTIMILKLDSNGVYQWHTFHGSESYERGEDIAIDSINNIYVVGSSSGDWPSVMSSVECRIKSG